MARNIRPTKLQVNEAEAQITLLNGMTEDEKTLFFSVVSASISEMSKNAPLSQVMTKQILFRSYTKSAIQLGMMFVQEYRNLNKVNNSLDSMIDG
jgi:hypothetical protein